MTTTIDTIRVQEAILKHSISEAVKKYIRETGHYPNLNFSKPKPSLPVVNVVVEIKN